MSDHSSIFPAKICPVCLYRKFKAFLFAHRQGRALQVATQEMNERGFVYTGALFTRSDLEWRMYPIAGNPKITRDQANWRIHQIFGERVKVQ